MGGGICLPLCMHLGEGFVIFYNKLCAFFEKACKISICPLEHWIFKGQFLSCLLSQEMWFQDSLKGFQILWPYVKSSF